jgi:hypothetical protein
MGRSAIRRRSPRRFAIMLAIATMALGLQVPPAVAGPVRSVRASSSVSGPQGGTITVAGTVSFTSSCPAATPIQLTSTPPAGGANLFSGGLGPTAPRDASGNFQAKFVIPPSTPVGSYTIGVICGQTTVPITEVLNVTAAPSASPKITVSPTSAHPGDAIAISGQVPTTGTAACRSGDAVALTSTAALFPPDGTGPQGPRDASGNFGITYKIPGSTPPGAYTIGMRCGGGNVGIQATLQVTATAATTTATSTTTVLPTTTTPTTTAVAAPTTTGSETTTASTLPAPVKKNKSSNSPLRWVAIGFIALVVLAGAVLALVRRGRV